MKRSIILLMLILCAGCVPYGDEGTGMPSNCVEWCKEYLHRQLMTTTDIMPKLPAIAKIAFDRDGKHFRHAVVVVQMDDEFVWFVDNGFLVRDYGGRMMWPRKYFNECLEGWLTI